MKSFRDKLAELPEVRRQAIKAEGKAILQDYLMLQETSKALQDSPDKPLAL